MKKRKWITLFLIVVAMSFALVLPAGCGPTPQPADTPVPPAEEAATEAPAPTEPPSPTDTPEPEY